jgi:hypothetical protein
LQLQRWLILPGTVTVTLLPALLQPALAPDAAIQWLRSQSRAHILQHLGEPDLDA